MSNSSHQFLIVLGEGKAHYVVLIFCSFQHNDNNFKNISPCVVAGIPPFGSILSN
jgi:hypothetical protein